MTTGPEGTPFPPMGQIGGQFGGPQKPSPISKFLAYARGFAFNSVILGGVVFAAEILFAPEYKPSHLMGGYVGNVEKAEIGAKQAASVEFARRQAEAQAMPQANAQMEAEINRQQQQVLAESLSGQSTMAIISDWACAIGSMIPKDAPGDYQTYGPLLRSGCGASDRIRDQMLEAQRRAGRAGSSIEPREATPGGHYYDNHSYALTPGQ